MKIKLVVAGTRTFDDYELLKAKIDNIRSLFENDFEIVSGCAKGADLLGERYAKEHFLSVKRFPADWNKYGKSAGMLRNEEMAKNADMCIVFWNGTSKGTHNMMRNALKYNLPLQVVRYDEEE